MHRALTSLAENYPALNFYSCLNLIGSHDLPRILTVLGEAPPEQGLTDSQREKFRLDAAQRRLGVQRLKMLALAQMTFPGVPCIYYGDEAGMEGYADPYNRGPFPWRRINAELRDWYRMIVALRNGNTVLWRGAWRSLLPVLDAGERTPDIYGFSRSLEENLAIVLLNRRRTEEALVRLDLHAERADILGDGLQQNAPVRGEAGVFRIKLAPLEGRVFLAQKG